MNRTVNPTILKLLVFLSTQDWKSFSEIKEYLGISDVKLSAILLRGINLHILEEDLDAWSICYELPEDSLLKFLLYSPNIFDFNTSELYSYGLVKHLDLQIISDLSIKEHKRLLVHSTREHPHQEKTYSFELLNHQAGKANQKKFHNQQTGKPKQREPSKRHTHRNNKLTATKEACFRKEIENLKNLQNSLNNLRKLQKSDHNLFDRGAMK